MMPQLMTISHPIATIPMIPMNVLINGKKQMGVPSGPDQDGRSLRVLANVLRFKVDT